MLILTDPGHWMPLDAVNSTNSPMEEAQGREFVLLMSSMIGKGSDLHIELHCISLEFLDMLG